jgi:predicted metal-dependent hydrolase
VSADEDRNRSPAFTAALGLFNAGRYLAAHELFEELWESTEGEDSDFYKGLIQAAIALHHLEEGRSEGARKLFSGHRRLLARYLPQHRGIDVQAFLAEMQRRFAEPDGAPPADDQRPRLRRVGER